MQRAHSPNPSRMAKMASSYALRRLDALRIQRTILALSSIRPDILRLVNDVFFRADDKSKSCFTLRGLLQLHRFQFRPSLIQRVDVLLGFIEQAAELGVAEVIDDHGRVGCIRFQFRNLVFGVENRLLHAVTFALQLEGEFFSPAGMC